MGFNFSREKNEEDLVKKAAIGNEFLKYSKYLTFSLLVIGTTFLSFLSGGLVLLIEE